MWKYFWSFRSLQFSDLKSQWTATSLLNSELMTSVTFLECAPIGNKNTTFSIHDLKYRKFSIKPRVGLSLSSTFESGALWRIYCAERAVVFTFETQGQEVGKQNHDIRMVCIEKEIEMARSIGVSVFFFMSCVFQGRFETRDKT